MSRKRKSEEEEDEGEDHLVPALAPWKPLPYIGGDLCEASFRDITKARHTLPVWTFAIVICLAFELGV